MANEAPPLDYSTPALRGMPVWAWVVSGLAGAIVLLACLAMAAVFWFAMARPSAAPMAFPAVPVTRPAPPAPATEP